jgi:hypothetical protein
MSYITVDEIKIASPCDVPWSGMQGDQFVRSCDACEKNVYNLSLLTREEANTLILEKEGKLCVRLFQRFDGTVLTADCPMGLRTIMRQYLRTRIQVIAAAAAIAGFLGLSMSSCVTEVIGVPPISVPDSTQHK